MYNKLRVLLPIVNARIPELVLFLVSFIPSVLLDSTSDSLSAEDSLPQEHFWYWNSFTTYALYLTGGTLAVLALSLLLHSIPGYVALVASLSSGIEALLGVPQFMLNYQRKNTQGLAVVLIMIWLGGDLYKFSYYIGAQSPVALVACAFFQICVDLCILS